MTEHTPGPRPYVINAAPGKDAPCPICGATLKWIEHPWSECPMHEAAPNLLAALERLEAAQRPIKPGKKPPNQSRIDASVAWHEERVAAHQQARRAIAKARGQS